MNDAGNLSNHLNDIKIFFLVDILVSIAILIGSKVWNFATLSDKF